MKRLFVSLTCEKFATQVNAEMLAAIRSLAGKEGRQIEALVDGAFADLIEKRRKTPPRPYHGRLSRQSRKYGHLYKKPAE